MSPQQENISKEEDGVTYNLSVRQSNLHVEEYTSEFNNLAIQIGLNKTNEQITECYLAGLDKAITAEMGVVHLVSLQDVCQYASIAEKKIDRYEDRRSAFSKWDSG